MARTRRVKRDQEAYYHLMSRTNGKRFLFERGGIKTELVSILKRTAAFCGVELKAYTAMSNHFHVIVKVIKPDEPIDTEELLRRVGILKGEKAREEVAKHWDNLLKAGLDNALKKEQNRLRVRMHDISEYMKLFKEEFDRFYKSEQKYCGSIWSGRFASTLIEDGEYLARCKRYIIYNPVRAGIVTQAKDYNWSWSENDSSFSGTGPQAEDSMASRQGWWLKRVAQIGAGKVLGSAAFVRAMSFSLGSCFHAKSVEVHPVGDIGHSTHGWILAREIG